MITIISIVLVLTIIALLILITETRKALKTQVNINKSVIDICSNQMNTNKILLGKIKDLEKSIELTDTGVCILYQSYKELDRKGGDGETEAIKMVMDLINKNEKTRKSRSKRNTK